MNVTMAALHYMILLALLIQVAAYDNTSSTICDECKCNEFVVDCSNRQLKSLRGQISVKTKILNAEQNQITSIGDILTRLTALQKLSISDNNITDQYGLPASLRLLFSSRNRLTNINGMFRNTRKLWVIDLQMNNIQFLAGGTFLNCRRLRFLDLSYNPVYQIHEGAFAGNLLETILLKGIRIKSLRKKSFSDLRGTVLSQLTVSSPNIVDIEPGVFDFIIFGAMTIQKGHLSYLPEYLFGSNQTNMFQAIYIEKMPLQELSPKTFDGVSQVQVLRLRYTELTRIPQGLFDHMEISHFLELSHNRLMYVPDDFLRSSPKLESLLLFSNNFTHLPDGVFAGLELLKRLLLFSNRLTELPLLTQLRNIKSLYIFYNELTHINRTTLRTPSRTLTTLHMYYNLITTIEDHAFDWLADGGQAFLSTDRLYQWPATRENVTLFSIGNDVSDLKWIVERSIGKGLWTAGFNCSQIHGRKFDKDAIWECEPCKVGYYTRYRQCRACPAGGFYQDRIGQSAKTIDGMECERCNSGTYVSLSEAPGKSAEDCKVCPTGTDKTKFAGYRACPCLDDYFRTDRFGDCKQCPTEGIECSLEYQKLKEGYWWTWNFEKNKTEGKMNMAVYHDFAVNILTQNDSYDKSTTIFDGMIPAPIKCPQGADACPVGDGIHASCGKGYEGWLCSECSARYYPWFEYCIQCPHWWYFLIEILLVTFVAIAIVAVAIWNYRQQHRSRRSLVDMLVGRFKIVLAFYQIAGAILTSFHDIQWPEKLSQLADVLKYLELNIFKLLAKPRCYIDGLQLSIYTEFLIGMIFSVSVILFPCFIYVCVKLYSVVTDHTEDIKGMMKRLGAKCLTAIVILFITFPSVCQVVLVLMTPACETFCLVENGTDCLYNVTKLRNDYTVDCDTGKYKHFQIAAYVSLIYVLGFPLCTFLLLQRHTTKIRSGDDAQITHSYLQESQTSDNEENSDVISIATSSTEGDESPDPTSQSANEELLSINNLGSNEMTEPVADDENVSEESCDSDILLNTTDDPSSTDTPLFVRFLSENYKPKFWYWEIVELTRKLLQTSLVVLWGSDDPFTLGLSIATSVVYTVIHAYVKPMKDKFEHWLQMLSLMAVFFNLLAAVYFKLDDPDEKHKEGLMTAFIFIVNISVILLAVGNVFIVIWKTVRRHRCNQGCMASCLCCCTTMENIVSNMSTVSHRNPSLL